MTAADPRLTAGVAADLLEQGRAILTATLALMVAAGLVLASGGLVAAALSLACGMAALYFGLRVGLDAALFRRLEGGLATADLDGALAAAGLLRAPGPDRPLHARIAGARRLLVRQGLATLAQAVALPFAMLGG